MRPILFLYLLVIACSCSRAQAMDDRITARRIGEELQRLTAALTPTDETKRSERRQTLRVQHTAVRDGYEGAERWCEPPAAPPCHTDADCRGVSFEHSLPHRCVRPWWAPKPGARKGKHVPETKVCAAPWPTRTERRWRSDRIAAIVAEICSGGTCDPKPLAALLTSVATRESTLRPWKVHRLDADVRANRVAWLDQARSYGHRWVTQPMKRKGKTVEVPVAVKFLKSGNRYYNDEARWRGHGLFGMNSPLFVAVWDPMAPPEVLCREVEAIDTYLARARKVVRQQADLGITPTWATVHYAVSTGSLRPTQASIEKFTRKAKKIGIDPNARVTSRSFGRPLGTTVPARRLAAEILRGQIDARHPSPYAAGS